jgi:hypothetical protein
MARATKAREVLVVHEGGEAAAETSPTKGLPLFAGEDEITGIALYRMEPIEEGTIGVLPPDADEETIRRRHGGGVYRVSAKGVDGKFKGTRTVTIGGDPKFESKDAARRYKIKMAGLSDDDEPKPPPAPPAAPPTMAIPEILALVTQSHAQQMEMMRLQMAATKAEGEERERRARIEAEEREARGRREAEESRERDRQFNATMLTLVKSEAKAPSAGVELVTALMQGLKLGRQMSAGAEETPNDPVSLLIANLPGIIEHGKGLVQAGMQAAQQQNPAAPGGVPRIALSGPVATKLQAMVDGLIAKGYPSAAAWNMAEQALAMGVDALAQVPNAPTVGDPPPQPPPVRPAAPPTRKATAGATRATHKR